MGFFDSVTDWVGQAGGRRPDVLVVGGGLVGLELASQLRHHGADSVLVVEAGPRGTAQHINGRMDPDDATTLCFDHEQDPTFVRPWSSRSGPHYTRNAGLRRVLGGRSLYWYGVALPLERSALSPPWWPDDIVSDLTESWRGGRPLYTRVADHLADWTGDPTMFPGRAPGPVLGGFRMTSLPRAVRRDGPRWSAYSAIQAWQDEHGRFEVPDGIDVCSDTEALDVCLEDGRATGVFLRDRPSGRSQLLSGGRVVVCAGTVETSRLVIQARAAARTPAPGSLGGLADHIVQGFVLRLPPPESDRAAEFPTGAFAMPPSAAMRSYLRADVHRPDSGDVLFEVRHTGEQMPSEKNRVTCTPASKGTSWAVTIDCGLSAIDHEVVDAQRDDLCEFWTHLAVRLGLAAHELQFEPYGEQTRTNTVVLPSSVRTLPEMRPVTWASYLGTEDHEAGTVGLGTVLDSDHQLPDVPGLYVCGPAAHPRSGAANPVMTSLALAHRLAAVLTD